jgi:PAS domain S-box-containing protein
MLRKAIRVVRLSIAVLVLFRFPPVSRGAAEREPIRRVLILYEAGTAYPGINLIDQGIRAALDTSPYKLEVYREYMDSILFPDPADQQRFRKFYVRKYQNRRPNVIITMGPSPLKFMVEMRDRGFPGVPIVFCYPTWLPGSPTLPSDFTGVENELAPSETIQAALRLRPGTRHIILVGGTSFIDRQAEDLIKEQLKTYEGNFDVSYLTNLTMPDLLERLKRLPNHSIVLFTDFSQDAAGRKFISGSEAAPAVAAAANAPVFSLFDSVLNHGEVGGKLSSLREEGMIAGGMALRIIKGERPQDVPRVRARTMYMFDWRALKRWGLNERELPAGSILLNREPTFWGLYWRYVLTGVLLLLAQALIIFALLWQRARRRKAEAELRDSQLRLQDIVEAAMDAVIAIDEGQRIVVFNSAAEQMFGCPAGDAIGSPIDRFISERSREAHHEHIRHFDDTGTTARRKMGASGALWGLRANGKEFPIEAAISQTRAGAGGKKLFTVIVRDITERKQAEEARFRHAAIVESSDDGIVSLDMDGVITGWNAAAQRMYGYAAAEVQGRSVYIIIPPEVREEEAGLFGQVLDGKMVEHYETIRMTKDGKRIDVSLTLSPLRDWTGKIVGASKIARDITLGKLAEAALRESEERFRLIANAAPVMIWMSGPDKRCTYVNRSWLEFTGRALLEELGNGRAEQVHPEDLEPFRETYSRTFEQRESFQMEYRLRRHDGEYRWIFDHGVPRFHADGSFAGYIGSVIDVTERKQAEEALSSVSRRLIEAHEEERTWIARELHDDINQRIALLAVSLEGLKQDLPASNGQMSRRFKEVQEHVADLGIDIQALSHRLHSSKLEYLGLAAACEGFCREFSVQQNVEIDFHSQDIPKELPQETALCLFRVLQEALQNAAKHSGVRHFQVLLKARSNEIQLSVYDSGVGFDMQKAMSGNGLGFTSMKERMKLIDGHLSIDLKPQGGTTIHARAPLKPKSMSRGAAGQISVSEL